MDDVEEKRKNDTNKEDRKKEKSDAIFYAMNEIKEKRGACCVYCAIVCENTCYQTCFFMLASQK